MLLAFLHATTCDSLIVLIFLSDSMTDPVLLFDSQSNRWFATISDTTVHSIRVAVSQTADPTGVWRVYNFPFGSQSDNCSDQPFMGVSEDKFVVTVNNWANHCKWYSIYLHSLGVFNLQL